MKKWKVMIIQLGNFNWLSKHTQREPITKIAVINLRLITISLLD